MLVYGLELPLHSNLQGQFRIENELSKVSFVDQVVKVLSDGSAIHCEVALPFVEGAVVSRSKPSWVRWVGSSRMPNLRLVFDGVEDVIDLYSEGVRYWMTRDPSKDSKSLNKSTKCNG